MPASSPLPTITDLRRAFSDALHGRVDGMLDTRDGSSYDVFGGVGSLVWSREAQRDRDLFRAVYTSHAAGDDLTERVSRIYGVDRIEGTYGAGTAILARESVSAGAGTIFEGTRIVVYGATRLEFRVSTDVDVPATADIVQVPISATIPGSGTACSAVIPQTRMGVDDPLWATWYVASVNCQDGTDYEPPEVLIARARQSRLDARAGANSSILAALTSAGAKRVALFESTLGLDPSSVEYYTDDTGICACYVGDSSYQGTPTLIRACTAALENARVCGAEIVVLPMVAATLRVTVDAVVWGSKAHVSSETLKTSLRRAVAGYFASRENKYSFRLAAVRGAIANVTSSVRLSLVTVRDPLTGTIVPEPVVAPNPWPGVLTQYSVNESDIAVTIAGSSGT